VANPHEHPSHHTQPEECNFDACRHITRAHTHAQELLARRHRSVPLLFLVAVVDAGGFVRGCQFPLFHLSLLNFCLVRGGSVCGRTLVRTHALESGVVAPPSTRPQPQCEGLLEHPHRPSDLLYALAASLSLMHSPLLFVPCTRQLRCATRDTDCNRRQHAILVTQPHALTPLSWWTIVSA
jgi:hypothetical protein